MKDENTLSGMTAEETVNYINQSLDMGLAASMPTDENSYNNSFETRMLKDGILIIPRMPAGYMIDNDFYQKAFKVLSTALYPQYTLLKQPSIYLVPIKTSDIHTQRGLFFPMKKGIPKRLIIPDLKKFVKNYHKNAIPLMQDLSISYDKISSIAVSGNTGSGKSFLITYFLEFMKSLSDSFPESRAEPDSYMVVVDPKMDEPSRWARENGVKVIYPASNRSKSDFVSEVNTELSKGLNLIHERQRILFDHPNSTFRTKVIVIDELASLNQVNSSVKNSFQSLLNQITLLGRQTRVLTLLASQQFDHTVLNTSTRDQASVRVQLGDINRRTTQYLFPDLDPSGIVIPIGKGTGLIQVIDDEHPYQVQPILSPTYYYREGKVL